MCGLACTWKYVVVDVFNVVNLSMEVSCWGCILRSLVSQGK